MHTSRFRGTAGTSRATVSACRRLPETGAAGDGPVQRRAGGPRRDSCGTGLAPARRAGDGGKFAGVIASRAVRSSARAADRQFRRAHRSRGRRRPMPPAPVPLPRLQAARGPRFPSNVEAQLRQPLVLDGDPARRSILKLSVHAAMTAPPVHSIRRPNGLPALVVVSFSS